MYNGKPTVAAALSTDTALIAKIPKVRMFSGIADFEGKPVYPYLTYEELANGEALHADDEEVESEVTFRIHLWGTNESNKTADMSTMAGHVNRIMHAIEYGRNYSQDSDEQLDSGLIIRHKIMSFSGTFPA